MDIELDKLEFKVKVPQGCTLVTALKLPNGQLIDLDDLVEQDSIPVSSVLEFMNSRESTQVAVLMEERNQPRAPSDREAIREAAQAVVQDEASSIDPDNLVILEGHREPPGSPVKVMFPDALTLLRAFLDRKAAGSETCVLEDPRNRTIGFIDYTRNEHCAVSLAMLAQSSGQLLRLSDVELGRLCGITHDMELARQTVQTLIKSNEGRAKLFGSDAYGFDQPGEKSMEEVLSSLWDSSPSGAQAEANLEIGIVEEA